MASKGVGSFSWIYILIAFAAGAITITQMILNSTFAIYKGPMKASQWTYIAGMSAAVPSTFSLDLRRRSKDSPDCRACRSSKSSQAASSR